MVGPDKDGSLNKVITLSEKLGVRRNVRFTGKLGKKEWVKLSKEYDIFLNTSNYDNQPVSLLEAMGLGMPIVSTNVGGIKQLLTHNQNAKVVEPDNVKKMTNEINDYLSNKKLAEDITINARKYVKTHFCKENVMPLWFDIINQAINNKLT